MVLRANQRSPGIGGHLATYASAATLYEVGFNHFWRAPSDEFAGDLVYMQGHSSPGIYARAFVEGRLDEDQLDRFRQEVGGNGLSSYPHPWLMPDFWQFATVSMGLTPLLAIYQARFLRYLEHRGLVAPSDRKVWAMLGDGEMDEPESLGAISLAAREGLDNLIFVINCNLQRLDGPVRGNGKIIQELEGVFRGAGWNVIKVIWGGRWDRLLARDDTGLLLRRMEHALDGDYQNYKAHGGRFTREHFFGTNSKLAQLVADLSDEEIWRLNRGGHDPVKVYNAYREAVAASGRPTVILAKTVKGYGLGSAQASNTTHQVKKLALEQLRDFRDRHHLPIADADLEHVPYYRPADDSPEIAYVKERRRALGGPLPRRSAGTKRLDLPPADAFGRLLEGSGERAMSTTMAFVRWLTQLVRDKGLGARVVPIVPDEARTFGMEGLFRSLKIYSSVGQLYDPVDAAQLLAYREARDGQILEEGITEAGAMASWIAAATAYANHDEPMVPFYIYYSMFGFQRVGDLAWAAADMQARGFLLGATAGRTTLAGEGLQHQDGHSHVLASVIPSCRAYDPCFAYELAVILDEGLKRMLVGLERVFYYVTLGNESYPHPPLPTRDGVREGIVRGLYLLREAGSEATTRIQLLGGGPILREVIAAADRLEEDWGIGADVWSAGISSTRKRSRGFPTLPSACRDAPARPSPLPTT
jgi:pyruvate dehydrogenase E1 component